MMMMEPRFRVAWNSYVISNRDGDNFKNYIKDTSSNSDSSPRVTFLCGSEEVSVSSILAGVAFPALRDVLKSFQSGQCSCDLLFRNEATIFISLDSDIDVNILWMLKQIVGMSISEVKMTSVQLSKLRDLMSMLGMSLNLLIFEELASGEHCEDGAMQISQQKYEEVVEIDISSSPETEDQHFTLDEVTEAVVEVRQSEDAEMDQSNVICTSNPEDGDEVSNDCAVVHREENEVTPSNVPVFTNDDDDENDTHNPLPSKNETIPAPICHNVDLQIQKRPVPEVSQQLNFSPQSSLMEDKVVKERSPLKPKPSGKRKTIDDAIENITAVAKKKAKEEVKDGNPAIIAEEKIGNINDVDLHQSSDILVIHTNRIDEESEEKILFPNVEMLENEGEGPAEIEPIKSDNNSKVAKCPEEVCKNSKVTFKNKRELLNHVAVAHFNATLLEAYPYRRNSDCPLCISNQSKKIFSAKTKAAWVTHIVTHEEILDVLPNTVTEAVKFLPLRARNQNKTTRKDTRKDVEEEVRNMDETEPISDQLSDGPLVTSYVEPTFDFESYEEKKTSAPAPLDEVFAVNRHPSLSIPVETSSEEEKSKSPLSSPIHTLTPAASTEMRRMSFYKMDSVPATVEDLPRPLAQSSVALASFPRRLEPFPPPLAQSSFVDIPTDPGYEESKDVEVLENEELNLGPLMEIANESYKSNDDEDRTTTDTDPTLMQTGIHSPLQSSEQSSGHSPPQSSEQSPQQSVEESIEPSPSASEEADRDILDSLTCTVCSSRTFGTRQELLHHLSLTHFNMRLLKTYPLKDGNLCPIENCNVQLGNKVVHLLHVGKLHEKVLTFLETQAKEDHQQQEQFGSETTNQLENEPGEESDQIIIEDPQTEVTTAVTKAPDKEQDERDMSEGGNQNGPEVSQVAVTEKNDVKEPTIEDVVDEDLPVVRSETLTVKCILCEKNNKVRTFAKKSEFLKHLSLIHYGKQILTLFPWTLGDRCKFCLESASRKEYRANKKELHVCHVAIMHQKLFELLPPEVSQLISSMPAPRRPEGRSKPTPALAASLQCKYCDLNVPRSEMRDHLISHKTLIAQRANQEFKFSP